MIRMARRGTQTKEEMADALLGRLRALSDATSLVRPPGGARSLPRPVGLHELITTILAPFRPPMLSGPDIELGEHATSAAARHPALCKVNRHCLGAAGRFTRRGAADAQWLRRDA